MQNIGKLAMSHPTYRARVMAKHLGLECKYSQTTDMVTITLPSSEKKVMEIDAAVEFLQAEATKAYRMKNGWAA